MQGISHEYLFLGCESLVLMFLDIGAAIAGTLGPTVFIIRKALAVQLQTLRLTAVASLHIRVLGSQLTSFFGLYQLHVFFQFFFYFSRDLFRNDM